MIRPGSHRLSRCCAVCGSAWLALAAACNKSAPPQGAIPPTATAGAPAATAKETPAAMNALIPNSELEACLQSEGSVALVLVKASRLNQPGTRGQQTEADVEIERHIHGLTSGSLTVVGYSAGKEPSLAKGRRYILAFSPDPRVAPRQSIEGFVEVPPGAESQMADAHAQAIAEIKPAP